MKTADGIRTLIHHRRPQHTFHSDSDHGSNLMEQDVPIAMREDRPTQGRFYTVCLRTIGIRKKMSYENKMSHL